MGFRMYSKTFIWMACLAYSKSSKPEKTTNLAAGSRPVRMRQSSSPSKKGILMSVRTTSGERASASSRASWPFSASPTRVKPRLSQSIFRLIPTRMSSSSSTSSTRYRSIISPPYSMTNFPRKSKTGGRIFRKRAPRKTAAEGYFFTRYFLISRAQAKRIMAPFTR